MYFHNSRVILSTVVGNSFLYLLQSKMCLSLGMSLRQSSVMLEIKAGPGRKPTEKHDKQILKYK